MNKEFLTVSELNILIKDVLNYGFPNAVWICGEIQGFDRNRDKKHIFFELCEKDPASKDITARIGLVIFAGRKNYIDEILKSSENAFQLKDDIEVKFLCRVDFYPPHGAVRLTVESIDPVYTLGKIAQERQKLIALLKQKGTLEKNKSLALPLVPLNIGLITSHDSAAYNDFVAELKRSRIGFKIFLINSLMQGKGAEKSVCVALRRFNRLDNIDVVVITRGGGSIAELSCFDSQKIAEAIALSQLPVLSGIGHEINTTVTDLAAHMYAKTPTAIAQFLSERVNDFLSDLEERLEHLSQLAQEQSLSEKRRLRMSAISLQNQTTNFLKQHQRHIVQLTQQLRQQPLQLLRGQRQDVNNNKDIFLKAVKVYSQTMQQKIGNYQKLVDLLNPKNTMKRGFSVVRTKEGKIVRKIADVKLHENLVTEVLDGVIHSEVHSTKREGKSG
ncbi:MAG: exodeoxyribonuclease VII large subunit [Omnitrophica WOR_2 bacterium RIFCSPHIGHO2_01_FULL_48_9]|nr:MAG: exodeoxyribonuclease VII large subunit [Omnitrophica WOR_2 bacterium RIFCSPHIGHO2_02_FULL_48_11]OGX33638.1 MAG: exodeoxyribonuclease VII large subunit [Omnitrophica WOR_2 bacterium RIFCSPHIGHO2_01_FULL_48_9]